MRDVCSVIRELGAVALVAGTMACADVKASGPADLPVPRQLMVVIDVSGSRDARELEEGRELLDRVLETLSYRDRVVLIEMHEQGDGGRERWADTMPSARRPVDPTAGDREALANAIRAARAVAPVFFDSTRLGRVRTTDVFATMQTIAEYQRDAGGRRPVIVLLSDMLHSTPALEMSRAGGIPDETWITRRKQDGTLPSLDDACVLVIGADFTTPHGVAVRRFWMEYFAAAGAQLAEHDYRRTITPGARIACE